MRLLIDTNVVLDFLGSNKGFEDDAETIFKLALDDKAIELVSASAITDIYYILKRDDKDNNSVRERFASFRRYIHILPVTEENIDKAFSRNWKDFEDAVQYTVAEANDVDYIITRNVKDFEETEVPSMTPKDFIQTILPKITLA